MLSFRPGLSFCLSDSTSLKIPKARTLQYALIPKPEIPFNPKAEALNPKFLNPKP